MEELFEKRKEIHAKIAELSLQYDKVNGIIDKEREKCPHTEMYFVAGHPYGSWNCSRCHKFLRND